MSKSPLKTIKEYCINCCGGSIYEVKNCPATQCELYPFRLGKNPYSTPRVMTEEQRKEASERLRKAREKK